MLLVALISFFFLMLSFSFYIDIKICTVLLIMIFEVIILLFLKQPEVCEKLISELKLKVSQ